MINAQKPDKTNLNSIIADIRNGAFVIPDFQREFDWEPWDVRDLIKSVFLDYYIGTLLLWEGDEVNYKILSCTPIWGFNNPMKPNYIVLDGQQRLTALYWAFFGPNLNYPRRKNPVYFFMKIDEFYLENYDKAFYYSSKNNNLIDLLNSKEQQFENNILPFKIFGDSSPFQIIHWITEYKEYWTSKYDNFNKENDISNLDEDQKIFLKKLTINKENTKKFENYIEELLNKYQISYIELKKNIDVGKVCDIFTQINSKGVQLSIFDLLNAILRPKNIFLKSMWLESKDRINFLDPDKMKIYVLQVMSILLQSYCSPKYLYNLVPDAIKQIKNEDGNLEQIILINNSEEFINLWNESIKIIEKSLNSIKNPRDYGSILSKYVPYPSIIPSFSAIKRVIELNSRYNNIETHKKVRKWYWSSIFLNRYSSSVESTSAKDFMDLKKWFDDSSYIPECILEFASEYDKLDLQKETSSGSAIYKAVFSLLVINESRDWNSFDLPEHSELDDHHIVPYSKGKNIVGKDINSILNRTPLTKETNRIIIHDSLPNQYLQEMFDKNSNDEDVYKVLESHLISRNSVKILLRNPFTKEDYYEFINERRNSIIHMLKTKILELNNE